MQNRLTNVDGLLEDRTMLAGSATEDATAETAESGAPADAESDAQDSRADRRRGRADADGDDQRGDRGPQRNSGRRDSSDAAAAPATSTAPASTDGDIDIETIAAGQVTPPFDRFGELTFEEQEALDLLLFEENFDFSSFTDLSIEDLAVAPVSEIFVISNEVTGDDLSVADFFTDGFEENSGLSLEEAGELTAAEFFALNAQLIEDSVSLTREEAGIVPVTAEELAIIGLSEQEISELTIDERIQLENVIAIDESFGSTREEAVANAATVFASATSDSSIVPFLAQTNVSELEILVGSFFGVQPGFDLSDATDLNLSELSELTVAELDEILLEVFGPDVFTFFANFPPEDRAATGLSDEEIGALSFADFVELVGPEFFFALTVGDIGQNTEVLAGSAPTEFGAAPVTPEEFEIIGLSEQEVAELTRNELVQLEIELNNLENLFGSSREEAVADVAETFANATSDSSIVPFLAQTNVSELEIFAGIFVGAAPGLDLSEVTDLSLSELSELTVTELDAIVEELLGSDPALFANLFPEERAATGLSDEEIGALSFADFVDLVGPEFFSVLVLGSIATS